MMVAIVVASILLAGVIQLLVGNKQAYRIQEGASRLNENARFALNDLQYNLRMADHWGGVAASAVKVDSGLSAPGNDCTQPGWAAYSARGVEGYDGAATSPLAGCVANADYVPNTDVVVVRYGASDTDSTATANANAKEVYVRSALGRGGEILEGDAIKSGLPAMLWPDAAGIDNYPYVLDAYFVRPCSAPAGGTDPSHCDAADDGGKPTPTLVRLALSGSPPALVQQDVVEGVEQLQAAYGVDLDADGSADRYENATAVAAADDWSKVVSVRLSLLLRNPELDVTSDETGRTYSMVGGYTYTVPAAAGHYARKLFTYVFQVRNQNR